MDRKRKHDETKKISKKERMAIRREQARLYYEQNVAAGSPKRKVVAKTTGPKKNTGRRTPPRKKQGKSSIAIESEDDDEEDDAKPEAEVQRPVKRARRTPERAQAPPQKSPKKPSRQERKDRVYQQYQDGTLFGKSGSQEVELQPVTDPSVAAAAAAAGGQRRRSTMRRSASGPFNSPMPAAAAAAAAMVAAEEAETGPRMPVLDSNDDSRSPTLEPEAEDTAGFEEESDDEMEEEPLWKKVAAVLKSTNFLTAVVLFGAVVIFNSQAGGEVPMWAKQSIASNLCYLDSVPNELDVLERCNSVPRDSWVVCPTNAVCERAAIVRCVNAPYEHLSNGTGPCVATPETRESVEKIAQLLEKWVTAEKCDVEGMPFTVGRIGDRPFFFYSQVMGEYEMGMDKSLQNVIKTTGHFDLFKSPDGKNLHIALSDSHNVETPLDCFIKNALRDTFRWAAASLMSVLKVVWRVVLTGLGIYWSLFMETPTPTILFTVVFPTFVWVVMSLMQQREQRRLNKRQIDDDHSLARRKTYAYLKSSAEEHHPILMVRDRILSDTNLGFHNDSKARDRLLHTVWPMVVDDISRDNRVIKSKMKVSGRPRECWKWCDL